MTSLSYLEPTSSIFARVVFGLTDKPSLFRCLCSYTYMHTFIAMRSTIFQYLQTYVGRHGKGISPLVDVKPTCPYYAL